MPNFKNLVADYVDNRYPSDRMMFIGIMLCILSYMFIAASFYIPINPLILASIGFTILLVGFIVSIIGLFSSNEKILKREKIELTVEEDGLSDEVVVNLALIMDKKTQEQRWEVLNVQKRFKLFG